jgi:ketosteroid isomerase-like protein
MYHFFVRRKVAEIFRHLNEGDFAFVVAQFAPDAEHWFAGDHALAGCRRTSAEIAAWYRRLATVFPGICFTVRTVTVSGGPWDTRVVVEWADSFPRGEPLSDNQGVFVITLRWGKATRFHVYCDTKGLEVNLDRLAAQGLAEAGAPLIGVAEGFA